MSTSLAQQLQARKTVDSARLQSAKTLKNPPSFIYTPRHASSVTTADLHALAANSWDQLAAIDPFFGAHYKEVLGEQAKTLDRTGLTKEENDKVGKTVDRVLRALGKHMLLKPAGVVLEWLIRRFRVQDFNVPALIALFLPYHATPHFPSALNVIPEPNLAMTPFAALIPAKKTLAPLPLVGLIDLFPPFSRTTIARPLLDFVLHLPLDYLKNGETPHRALTAFWLQAIAAYLDRAGTRLPDGERAAVLSTILEVLRSARSAPDTLLASYILVARFALHNPFDAETLRVVLKGVVTNRARGHVADEETDAALVTTLVVISQLGEEDLEVGGGKKFLGNSGWKSLIRTPRLDELVLQSANQYDSKRFMKPFLQTLAEDALTSADSAALLSSLLVPRSALTVDDIMTLPTSMIPIVLSSCFAAIVSNPTASPSALQRPLAQIYQRYPAVWTAQSAVFTARAKSSADETAISRLMEAMGSVLGGSSNSASAVVLSASAPDVALRVQALRDVLKDAEDMDAQGNSGFVRDTLVARLSEPEADVAGVLFGSDAIDTLHKFVPAKDILAALTPALLSKREKYLASVLSYLAGPFVVAFPRMADAVVQTVFWPRLLATKAEARQHILAMSSLKGSHLEKSHAWLQGLGLSAVTRQDLVTSDTNGQTAEVIAKNMAACSAAQLDELEHFLLEQLTSGDKLAAVVALRLAGKMEKVRRVYFTSRILRLLRVARRGLDAIAADNDGLREFVSAENSGILSAALQHALYSRPAERDTSRQLQGALVIGALKSIHPLPAASWSWLDPEAEADEASAYRILCREVYDIAHSHHGSRGAVALSSHLLEVLFSSLVTDDAIAFLAATYTTSAIPLRLRLAALRDTTAFIEVLASATATSKGKVVDWQLVIPSLVVALSDVSDDKSVRVEALKALETARESLRTGPVAKVGLVYGRDKFYGPATTDRLRYLDLADVVAYLDKLLDSRAELTLSPAHLRTLHASLLDVAPAKESPKKRKQQPLSVKVATYLVSHVASWKTALDARVKLLAALADVRDKDKSLALVALVSEAVAAGPDQSRREPDLEVEYARLLLAPYHGAARKWLEGDDTQAVEILVTAIETPDVTGLRAALRAEALRHVSRTVFATVRAGTRLELFKRLVRLAVEADGKVADDIAACLREVKPDSETVSTFFGDLKTGLAAMPSKGAKRGRVSVGGSASPSSRTERLPELVRVLECVDSTSVVPTPALLLNMFDILAALVDLPASAGQADIAYPGQLVLTSLARLIERVTPELGVSGESIRMTPVLDFMRSSVNPQTYHQALLLLAQLGPLVPDQLVHNIMPIFTFMGANVLQRDDAYSLRVVDQTLGSIVPALVKALQKTARGRAGLLHELKDLLRNFTDAAAHVPRHRRINLFVRLVDTLGSKDFLSAVVMLLADKAGKATEDSVALPLALVENFTVDVQLATYRQIIDEIGRIVSMEPSFLVEAAGTAAAPRETAPIKEQAMNLLDTLGFMLEAKQLVSKVDSARAAGSETVDAGVSDTVRGLLDLASAADPAFEDSDRAQLAAAAEYDVRAAVALLSTKAFGDTLLWLLETADPAIQPRVFALLRARLPFVKTTRRSDLTSAINAVVAAIQARLESGAEGVAASLETLETIADAAVPEVDPALAKIVPHLIKIAGDAEVEPRNRSKALTVLKTLAHRLGPRLIPLVGKLVPFALELLHVQAEAGPSAIAPIAAGSFEVLEGLFVSVPAFIGGQLDRIFSAILSTAVMSLSAIHGAAVAKARATLLSTAAKKLPAKTLFPAIVRLHGALTPDERSPLLGLLDLLNRALRYGKTADVVEHYRAIFKLFLSVLDLRRVHSEALDMEDVVAVEDHALGAFVQFILKLNEQLFRPLFLRTYDWAVIDLAEEADAEEHLVARRTVLYRIVDRLLGQLRSIFVPYFAFMLDQTVEVLEQAAKGTTRDAALWAALASALTKSFDCDENGFWTPARLAKLSTPIAHQIEVPPSVAPVDAYSALVTSYVSLLGSHESHLKTFNSRLLHLTRSDDLRVKRAAIDTLDAVWEEVGDGMLGLVPETTPFLAETREETEGGVEAATRRLVKRIEDHLGESLDEYLEQ